MAAQAPPPGQSKEPERKHEVPAVLVRRAHKAYGKKKNQIKILNNLNMTVIKGTIYGLLGSSGCGKTTLLSCVVGLKKLDSGSVYVLGGKPGTKGSGVPGKRIGFMPQEIALFGEFSIKETVRYFGWIYGINTRKIDRRTRFLVKLLALPDENRFVKNLSGGQQRRVSFAVALMHDPELLILDEPTVGVDPVLRQSIWEHLVSISKLGETTIIITTHYIEEASEANCIGLMRSGYLLAEESPAVLIKQWEAKNLEEVFLKLAKLQKEEIVAITEKSKKDKKRFTTYMTQSASSIDEYMIRAHSTRSKLNTALWCLPRCFRNLTTRGKLKALLIKCALKMIRNIGVMLFMFGLPMIQVVLFCVAIGTDPVGLPVAVINKEKDDNSTKCPFEKGCNTEAYGCRFLSYLHGTMEVEYYTDLDDAKESVRNGSTHGVIYINDKFTQSFLQRSASGASMSDDDLDLSEIKVWLDMAEQQVGLLLYREILYGFRNFAADLLKACGKNPRVGDIPVKFEEPIYGENTPSFRDFVASGIILTIIFFLAVALTSAAMIIERSEGLLDRSYMAGVTPGEVLFAHVVTQFVVVCGQTTVALVFMLAVFQVTQKGYLILVILIVLIQGLCGMCFGFFISSLCSTERTAMQLSLGSFYPMLLLSGVIWPIEGMNYYLRNFARILPLTMSIQALRSVMLRGRSIEHFLVYIGFISLGCWILIFLVISLIVLRNKR